MRRLTTAVLALLLLAACSSAETASRPAASGKPTGSATASATATAGTSATGPPADVCGFLREVEPKLAAVDTPVGRLAQFAVAFAGFVSDHPDQQFPTAQGLDTATERDCPAERKTVLELLEYQSFDEAL